MGLKTDPWAIVVSFLQYWIYTKGKNFFFAWPAFAHHQ
jgi:hypothetical protein